MLVKDAGYSLRDIRGSRSVKVRSEERTDLISRIRRAIPFLNDPSPRVCIEKHVEPGMKEDEVMRRLVYHDEIEQIREEKSEEEVRRIQRQNLNKGYK